MSQMMNPMNRNMQMGYQGMPYQTPQPAYAMPQAYAQQPQPQAMTPPTIHADIFQVAGEEEAINCNVAAGTSQMMINREETEIYIKTAYANGQSTLDVYLKRPPKPQKPEIDPAKFVTWDGLEERLAALMQPAKRAKKAEEGEA